MCEYEGSTRNNIICAGRDHPLGWVFIDPSAPAAERYKAVGPGANYFRDGKPDPEIGLRALQGPARSPRLGRCVGWGKGPGD